VLICSTHQGAPLLYAVAVTRRPLVLIDDPPSHFAANRLVAVEYRHGGGLRADENRSLRASRARLKIAPSQLHALGLARASRRNRFQGALLNLRALTRSQKVSGTCQEPYPGGC